MPQIFELLRGRVTSHFRSFLEPSDTCVMCAKVKTPTFDLCMVCMKTAKFYYVSRMEIVGHVTLLLERTKIVTFSTRHAQHIRCSLNNILSIEFRECVEIVKFARQFGKH